METLISVTKTPPDGMAGSDATSGKVLRLRRGVRCDRLLSRLTRCLILMLAISGAGCAAHHSGFTTAAPTSTATIIVESGAHPHVVMPHSEAPIKSVSMSYTGDVVVTDNLNRCRLRDATTGMDLELPIEGVLAATWANSRPEMALLRISEVPDELELRICDITGKTQHVLQLPKCSTIGVGAVYPYFAVSWNADDSLIAVSTSRRSLLQVTPDDVLFIVPRNGASEVRLQWGVADAHFVTVDSLIAYRTAGASGVYYGELSNTGALCWGPRVRADGVLGSDSRSGICAVRHDIAFMKESSQCDVRVLDRFGGEIGQLSGVVVCGPTCLLGSGTSR